MLSKTVFAVTLLAVAFSVFPQSVSAKPEDGYAALDCNRTAFTSIGDENKGKKRNTVKKGGTLTWFIIGPTGTVVSFKFEPKTDCSNGTSPFEGGAATLKHTIVNAGNEVDAFISPKVSKESANDECYGYSITCTFPNTGTAVIDPIIDVPKTRVATEQQAE